MGCYCVWFISDRFIRTHRIEPYIAYIDMWPDNDFMSIEFRELIIYKPQYILHKIASNKQ